MRLSFLVRRGAAAGVGSCFGGSFGALGATRQPKEPRLDSHSQDLRGASEAWNEYDRHMAWGKAPTATLADALAAAAHGASGVARLGMTALLMLAAPTRHFGATDRRLLPGGTLLDTSTTKRIMSYLSLGLQLVLVPGEAEVWAVSHRQFKVSCGAAAAAAAAAQQAPAPHPAARISVPS